MARSKSYSLVSVRVIDQREMDTTARTIAKAVSWQLLGIVTMAALSYPHTGSLIAALSLAASASASGFVFFLVHERLWNAVRWGRAVERSRPPPDRAQGVSDQVGGRLAPGRKQTQALGVSLPTTTPR